MDPKKHLPSDAYTVGLIYVKHLETHATTVMLDEEYDLLDTSRFADFTINCGGYSWKAHRAMIVPASGYFARLCHGQFKEASNQSVTLEEDDPQMVARLIVFLYSRTYPMTGKDAKKSADSVRRLLASNDQAYRDQSEDEKLLTFHASLYGVADKFECHELKELCQNAYIWGLHGSFSIPDFISSIKVVYETTPETDIGLRKWAVFVAQGYKAMLQSHPSFKALFMSTPDFGWELATAYTEDQKYWCTRCEADTLQDYACICGQNGICLGNDDCILESSEFWCGECGTFGSINPGSLSAACDNPRSRFKVASADEALENALKRM
ncbi:hypothetical protein GJ744_002036 [Endocarpon pusillum]|uniref:BTB domain-containing protein n=1 Tax=Endocarpon pusillum TaxID=364733 RepID=A0A8H7DZ33_9EURO|nr:hypothetical protein GJ744_002036 [Endocarpon pusillum]